MSDLTTPATRPVNPRFSSGPCAKHPGFSLTDLSDAPLGRSHRAAAGKAKLQSAIDRTRVLLGVPEDYRIGIVPASDTGAYEMAMWTMLGARPVTMLAWESFGSGWVTDAVKQLHLDVEVRTADYGHLPDLSIDSDRDICFTWNGTTSGVRVPDADWIADDRGGLTLCDATSAAFAMDLPWDKLDVTTFSWQKVLGGEGAHGMLILSPRAVERLESYTPAWPLPKIFRLTKGGKLIEGIFRGETINTPSMLCVEDYLRALDWAETLGLRGLVARADASAHHIWDFCDSHDWIANLAVDPATRSTTSVCLRFTDDSLPEDFAKRVARRLEAEGVAFDVANYRDAPAGLRIWCGSTVEPADVAALLPWVEWAYRAERAAWSTGPAVPPHRPFPISKEPTMAPKVLISDSLSDAAVQIFRDRSIDVTFDPSLGKDKDRLAQVIGDYDGLAIRSATKVTEKLLAAAPNLKVVGRAGIGTDNIDKDAASRRGVIVMNTPYGNMITTAEHAIAMMFAVARQIPEANASTHAGKWEKSRFMGVELSGKTLGVIGAGNIGGIVCDRARALRMKVVAYDPFLSEERATQLQVEKVELDDLLKRADFITLHVPLTDQTKNILSAENIAKTKPGVRIVNCARGGLVDEEALAEALKSGHVAGAAFDVFATEPATASPLFNLPNVVVTPHLGAATTEAQENVALQVAEQMSDYLLTGAVTNALNMPSVTAEEAKVMGPWLKVAEHLGAFVGQMTDEPIQAIEVIYNGSVAAMNLDALNCSAIAGVMKATNPDVNMVSAPLVARERGVEISTTRQDKTGAFDGYIKLVVRTDRRERSVAGTVFSDGKPRFIQIKGINIDAEVGEHMLYTTNHDEPGIIGALGVTMGKNGVNIANFTLGRSDRDKDAIALLYLDEQPSAGVLDQLRQTGLFRNISPLRFNV